MAIEIEEEYLIVIDKEEAFDNHKIDSVEMVIEAEVTDIKIIVEMIAETRVRQNFRRGFVMIEVDQGKEVPLPEGIVTEDIIVQTQI